MWPKEGILMLLYLEILGVAQFSHRPTSPHLPLIKKGGLLQLKFGVVGVGVGVNIYLWAR